MKAITVKFFGPTNTHSSRYRVTCDAMSITVYVDYSLNPNENAIKAAKALVDKLSWNYGPWIGGEVKDGWVFVCDYYGAPKFGEKEQKE